MNVCARSCKAQVLRVAGLRQACTILATWHLTQATGLQKLEALLPHLIRPKALSFQGDSKEIKAWGSHASITSRWPRASPQTTVGIPTLQARARLSDSLGSTRLAYSPIMISGVKRAAPANRWPVFHLLQDHQSERQPDLQRLSQPFHFPNCFARPIWRVASLTASKSARHCNVPSSCCWYKASVCCGVVILPSLGLGSKVAALQTQTTRLNFTRNLVASSKPWIWTWLRPRSALEELHGIHVDKFRRGQACLINSRHIQIDPRHCTAASSAAFRTPTASPALFYAVCSPLMWSQRLPKPLPFAGPAHFLGKCLGHTKRVEVGVAPCHRQLASLRMNEQRNRRHRVRSRFLA